MDREELEGLLKSVREFGFGLSTGNSVRVLEYALELQVKFDRVVACR